MPQTGRRATRQTMWSFVTGSGGRAITIWQLDVIGNGIGNGFGGISPSDDFSDHKHVIRACN